MIDLTKILVAVLDLLALIITYKVIPLLKAHFDAQQLRNIRAAAEVAVYAAEKLAETGAITNKLNYAMEWMREHGYEADRGQIEAAVKRLDMGNLWPVGEDEDDVPGGQDPMEDDLK